MLKTLFEHSSQPLFLLDSKTFAFLEANPAAEHYYGYSRSEFLKMTLDDLDPSETLGTTWRHTGKDGKVLYVEIVPHSVTYKSTKAQLLFIRPIAFNRRALHDLKNALSAILGFSELLSRSSTAKKSPPKIRHQIEKIRSAANRAANIANLISQPDAEVPTLEAEALSILNPSATGSP